MPKVNIVKQVKVDEHWKLVSMPRTDKGGYDWNALPKGRYFVEWWVGGSRNAKLRIIESFKLGILRPKPARQRLRPSGAHARAARSLTA